jgi:serine/threonine protein kinase
VSAEADKQVAQASKMCLACSQEFQGDMATCPNDGTALIALNKTDPFIGKTLADRYHVTEIIGKGGMGVVYLARHQMMDRLVALKMLQAELTQDELSVKRFQQEAKAASHLSHPHLITLHDFGIMPTGQPFLVMEYLEGVSLLDVLRSEGPMEPKRAVKIFSEVADGLYHAHKVGILHRDLKPSNIILINHQGDPDFVKIVDFGLAKLMPWSGKESQHLTKTGEVFGSPIYMSPEQCMGKPLWPTSDIYSLGITLFEALTGKPPFRGTNSIQTASKHMTELPPRFGEVRPDLPLPEGLEKVVLKCLNKKPEERFQDMAEFKDALQAGLNSDRVEMPASLMVSTRAIQAIPASAQIPASVVRKAIEPPPEREDRTALHPGIFIGAGVVALAGIAAFCFIPVSSKTEGTITFYDLLSNPGIVHVENAGKLTKLQIAGDGAPSIMHDQSRDSCLGSKVSVDFSHSRFGSADTGTLGALRFIPNNSRPAEEPREALSQVDDFLNAVCDNWEAKVREYDQSMVDQFLKENPGGYLYLRSDPSAGGLHAIRRSENVHRKIDQQYEASIRPAHAYKLIADGDTYTIYVDGSHFTVNQPTPYWKFEVKREGDSYKITSYEKSTEADWLKI